MAPLLLCVLTCQPAPSVAGVFALNWSLPWGIGITASGSLRTSTASWAADRGVAVSLLLVAARLTLTAHG